MEVNKMHTALVLMLCSAVVHVGVSQSVIPQTVPPQSICQGDDRLAFLETLPNGMQCILSIQRTSDLSHTPTQMAEALVNFCIDDCGGIYSKYAEFPCNDPVEAEVVRLTCIPTNGSATVGNVCYYALPEVIDPQVLAELSSCDNVTSNSSCTPGCREMLANLKAKVGCCFQNVYNNTLYDLQQFPGSTRYYLTQNQVDRIEKLTNPDSNPWMICEIEPPQMCGAPLFKAPPSPQCTTDDLINFLPSLPNPAVCGPSIANVLSLSATNDSTELANALDIVCNTDCGEAYSEFLKSTCNDQFQAETFRIWCIRTNGNANAGPYCRFAFEASLFNELSTCEGSSSSSCSPSCRSALTRFADDIGCCYQDLFNNTFYYQQQVLNEVITAGEFTTFTEINDPMSSPWAVCDVPVPSRCPNIQPPPEDCPRGTYRRNRRCEPCPGNTNITLSGGNATECLCLEGFFRSSEEGPSESCSAPPSGCRNIQAIHSTATQITLRWKRPINTGRDDFYYEIEYSDGEDTGEHSLESKMEYVQEEITGLKPDTRYEFTVTVNNGVSDQDDRNEDLRSCELTTRTMEGRPSPPRDVQGFCSVVVWKMPQSPNGKIIGYDLRIIHEEADILSESDGPFLVVRKVNQLIGALVQVRAKTRAGAGNWSEPVPLGCEEESVITCPPCNCPATSQPPAGLHFTIGGRVYGNNSVVSLTDVGEGEANALICRTDSINCCGTLPNRFGQFYYPSGVQIPVNNAGQGFYRNRGDQLIRLNRRQGATSPTGRYRCEIPDASGEMQNLYITLE